MHLTVITINYNNTEGLRKTLASVAMQTYPYIQHIIVDGNSTDESVEIIREYADNQAKGERLEVKGTEKGGSDSENNPTPIYTTLHNSTPPKHDVLWVSEPDKGIYNAMNKGIEIALGKRIVNDDHTSLPIANGQSLIAQTDYIQILNSGDMLAAPDVTERMMNALAHQCKGMVNECKVESVKCKGTENSEADAIASTPSRVPDKVCDFVGCSYTLHLTPMSGAQASRLENCPAIFYGNMIKEYPDGHRVKDTCGNADYTPESFLYFYKGTLNHDCAYIRKDLFEKYGLYNEKMKICSDWEWYVRAIVLGGEKTVYTNIDVTIFDMTGISESDGKNKDIILKERLEYLESVVPQSILHDYDMYSLPIVQYQRLEKYHLWTFVHLVERILFKCEKIKESILNLLKF